MAVRLATVGFEDVLETADFLVVFDWASAESGHAQASNRASPRANERGIGRIVTGNTNLQTYLTAANRSIGTP